MTIIGVISDTHGMLRTAAEKALEGVDAIIHAGDVGSAEVLKVLNRIAPTHAVRGNMDGGKWGVALPVNDVVDIDGALFYVLHDLAFLDLDPAAAGMACVVFGHSHKPALYEKEGVLYLNPGSAGPRRFTLPITLAKITLNGAGPTRRLNTEFIDLED